MPIWAAGLTGLIGVIGFLALVNLQKSKKSGNYRVPIALFGIVTVFAVGYLILAAIFLGGM